MGLVLHVVFEAIARDPHNNNAINEKKRKIPALFFLPIPSFSSSFAQSPEVIKRSSSAAN